MNRNVESHFAELPGVDIQRSRFDRSSSHKTSFDVGQIIPFYIDEVLPGDTFDVTTSCIVRLQTLQTPLMDNMYLDTYFFFCPNRILWSHWKEFMGENTQSAWAPSVEYSIPKTSYPTNGWNVGTIADYLGVPTGVSVVNRDWFPSSLPFRAYALCCDTWFRDQNVTDPLNISLGDEDTTGTNSGNSVNDAQRGGLPYRAAKYHDYFTSCLPAPQKGPSVNIFGEEIGDYTNSPFDKRTSVPVIATSDVHKRFQDSLKGARIPRASGSTNFAEFVSTSTTTPYDVQFGATGTGTNTFAPTNLWAELGFSNVSINNLRLAFQLQKFFEKNARAGTRYREILKEHFSVTSPDARMMIPEYLGGHRIPLQIHQIANQSQGESAFLGDLGAMSNTSDVHSDFIKSFTEHGYILGLCVVRYDHSYPQGLERFWTRKNLTDFYFPVFANLGEQPVYKGEIMLNSDAETDTNAQVFGYQEAWADYRYKPSRVSGEMRPGITNSLANWHLADYYTSVPSLSNTWIREDKNNVDRALAVTSAVSNQVFADFYVKNFVTRPMPMYSVPGLIDHH